MGRTVYVLLPDAREREWIKATLAKQAARVVLLDDIGQLSSGNACLIVSAEPLEDCAVQLIADLRDQGNSIAVIALGSHAVFRTAIDIARMDATDFLERPLSERELLQALQRTWDRQ
jgi:FixJ family two-component response regulator